MHALRHLGYAARFVSGYLIQLTADEKPVDGPAGASADFTDLHAWAEVFLPGAGWVGLDATSGLRAGEGHNPLAASPAPSSAAAISGMAETAEVTFEYDMKVQRVLETPRTSKPYSDAQWQALVATGARVDAALARNHVRLTMGGEPTFVAVNDRDAPEWNTDAIGPTKRAFAGKLLRKLAPMWAPGAALQQTLGKHYPGEQLPRWALSAHWRRDGEPVWARHELLAGDDDDLDADEKAAAHFAKSLEERLQIAPDYVQPAYEDFHYYLWRENRLPANVQVAREIGKPEAGVIRTALTVQAREGRLHVFIPPLPLAEDWLALAAAIEATAGELGTPVVLEGYPPARDPRLLQFSVTPDPGVIEVNIHPTSNWGEVVARTNILYETARQTGLPPRNSCWMGGMSEPAAAIMW